MRNVAELNSYILGCFKDEESGRVALYHYLKNFYENYELVTPQLINRFFSDALQLPHWQEKRVELFKDIHELLQRFFSQRQVAFPLDQIWDLSRMQFILINQPENLFAAVKHAEEELLNEGEKLRIIPDGDSHIVSIKRTIDGGFVVRTFNNLARIKDYCLVPLGPDQELFYDAGLELTRGKFQRLRSAPHSLVQFILNEQIQAQFISGFAFRQSQMTALGALSQEPRIFYPLKRLERYYVYRPSDPYYAELIATIDKALAMLQARSEGSVSFARQAFEGGQIAFDQIFPDDRVLYGKLKELAKLVTNSSVSRNVPSQTAQIHR